MDLIREYPIQSACDNAFMANLSLWILCQFFSVLCFHLNLKSSLNIVGASGYPLQLSVRGHPLIGLSTISLSFTRFVAD